MPRTFLSDERPIPPEPPRVDTLLAIRRRLFGRPQAEVSKLLKSFRTQVAAKAYLDNLEEQDKTNLAAKRIEPRLSDAELLRRQLELDRQWMQKLDADAARRAECAANAGCHTGIDDPDWLERRSERSWIWGDRR
jgi:hypothetical protein